jgi:hypothetical protein
LLVHPNSTGVEDVDRFVDAWCDQDKEFRNRLQQAGAAGGGAAPAPTGPHGYIAFALPAIRR